MKKLFLFLGLGLSALSKVLQAGFQSIWGGYSHSSRSDYVCVGYPALLAKVCRLLKKQQNKK